MRDRAALRTAVAAVTALALGSGTAAAQSRLDTTIAVRSGARLLVHNYNGEVVIRGSNRQQIHIAGEYDRGRPEIEVSGSRVTVRTTHRRGNDDVELQITVPTGTAVEVNGMSVDVDITDVCGDVTVGTMNGDINIRCATDVQVNSVSGDISVADVRGRLEANATSGSIEARNIRGLATLRAVSGDISMTGMESAEIEAETVSGEVDYSGPIRAEGRYRFSSHSGDVTARISGTLNATVETETFSGEMMSDWPIQIGGPGAQPINKNLTFRIGTGGARVRMSSFSGTINLRRAGGASREE